MSKQKQTILITGGAGFIGSHIVDKFIDHNYQVIVVDNLSSGNKANLNSKAKFYDVDIKDSRLEKVFRDNAIDFVSHHAAQVCVSLSMKDPQRDLNENICGSVNLLNLCKQYSVKKIIIASTAAVYGVPEYLPVDEKHRCNFISFYGLSKHTMEEYAKLFGVDYIIFRYSNVYGPRQTAHGEAGVVSIFANRMLANKPVEIHGKGKQTRDFVFVEDIARANVLAIESQIKNEIFNISMKSKTSINELFNILKTIIGSKYESINVEERAGDIKESVLDNTKANKLIGFNPQVQLVEGLQKLLNS